MEVDLKKDLRVFKVGLEGLLMPSFFLLIRIISKKLVIIRKREGISTLGGRSMSDSLIQVGCLIVLLLCNRLHLARGDIARLVELHSCNWIVAITSWMSNCPV
jgi:hypothetical protein